MNRKILRRWKLLHRRWLRIRATVVAEQGAAVAPPKAMTTWKPSSDLVFLWILRRLRRLDRGQRALALRILRISTTRHDEYPAWLSDIMFSRLPERLRTMSDGCLGDCVRDFLRVEDADVVRRDLNALAKFFDLYRRN